MDTEASARQEASLFLSVSCAWQGEPTVLNSGALLCCREGSATLHINFQPWQIKTHLRNSRQNIKEIAWLYHFNDESFLCRYFKQHTGTTPQQYRKMM